MAESDRQLRERVHEIMWRNEILTGATDMIVEMIKEEKSKSYGLGYQDGQRKRKMHE